MTKPTRTLHKRRLRRAGLALGTALVGLTLGMLPASATAPSDAQHLLTLLNFERTSRGLPALRLEATMDVGARHHAARMVAAGKLFHSRLEDTAPAGWRRLGENVSRGKRAQAIHDALMASPAHRANILDPGFDYVGIGVAAGGSRMFASMKFADHPSTTIGTPLPPARGRWVSGQGVVSTAGGASFHGDLADQHLTGPIIGLEPTPSGKGYWLVATDGGVFTFGDAPFLGSAGGTGLKAPVVDAVSTPTGRGYWLVTTAGQVLAFGDARDLGSAPRSVPSPIVRINRRFDGSGYALYGADGGRYGFGTAHR